MKAKELIDLIPASLLDFLTAETQVDYKVQKLDGNTMFKLILYTLLTTRKGSLRVMETVFGSYCFKVFSKGNLNEHTKYNSIRDRINTINADYFERLFDECYQLFSNHLNKDGIQKVIRYDSTMVTLSGKLLAYGMKVGSRTEKRQIKFTIGFDGLLPRSGKVFKRQQELSEDLTLRAAIMDATHDKNSIAVFDRGIQSRKTFGEFVDNKISFVTRLKTAARFEVISENTLPVVQEQSGVSIDKDQLVHLFSGNNKTTKHSFCLITGHILATG